MTNKTLRVGEKTNILGTTLSIIDRNLEDNKHGRFWEYTCKLQNGKNWGLFQFGDSIDHYCKKKDANVDDIMYCLISDYQTVQCSGESLDDIEQYLIDCFGYTDIREIKRIAKALLKNYELIERVFTDWDIEKLIREYEEY